MFCCLFYFKQKTAYDFRISDWSSTFALPICRAIAGMSRKANCNPMPAPALPPPLCSASARRMKLSIWVRANCRVDSAWASDSALTSGSCDRSEEHTSELQSLMRISYAVFCLKKKKKKTQVISVEKLLCTRDKQ